MPALVGFRLTIRLSCEEHTAIAEAAASAGVAKDSDWARRILLGAANDLRR